MSTLDEKLEPHQTTSSDVAKCKLKHLKNRFGVEPMEWRKAELIRVHCMGEMETWCRVSGSGDDADFELREKVKE